MPAGGATRLASPRVIDVLRAHAASHVNRSGGGAPIHVRSTLAQLTACRTAALGGHAWECAACGETRVAYNSCRNRFCPTCGGGKRAAWLDKLRSRILPVTHFHLVFTVPHELSRLMLANRSALYGLLFRAAWETLHTIAADPQHLGAEVGAVMALHTWGQNMEHHPHVHAVVPGGGLSPDAARWITPRGADGRYLLPVQVLSRLFRGKFLAGVKNLHLAGELTLGGPLAELADRGRFESFLSDLYKQEWVVYSQPPAHPRQGPDGVLKYLARYVAGAAISDARLISHSTASDGSVTFRVKNYRQGRKRQTLTLSGVEFTRRFALHILPPGFPRVRYYGLLSHRGGEKRLPRCRELLQASGPRVGDLASTSPSSDVPADPPTTAANVAGGLTTATAALEQPRCPRCDQPTWFAIAERSRPRLWDVLQRSGFAPAVVAKDTS